LAAAGFLKAGVASDQVFDWGGAMITRRTALGLVGAGAAIATGTKAAMADTKAVIDDFSRPGPLASNGATWRYVADGVMGGVSRGAMASQAIDGRPALRLTGQVSLDNNGGFIQLSLDLSDTGAPVDARGFAGIALDAFGNGETYNLHLRTNDLRRPWQSYRQSFLAGPGWQTYRLAFAGFEAHQTPAPLDISRLRRIAILAIGREFAADIAIGGVRFFA
jgi:hypothetical protein